MSLKRNLIWATLFTGAVGLSGCSQTSGTTSEVSGLVADGYLQNANVCLDLNANKKCDADEPSATTGAGGQYSFQASPAQIASAAILAEITAGVTFDTDIGGVVPEAYTLAAPKGKPEFVSPLTTMVQSKLELNPAMTAEQAEKGVKDDLGLAPDSAVDVYADFIAQGGTNNEYKKLHQTAQVVARVIAKFTKKLQNRLGTQGVSISDNDLADVNKIVMKNIVTQLPAIYSAASNRIDTFGEVSTTHADDYATGGVDGSALDNMTTAEFQLEKRKFALLADAVTVKPADALRNGQLIFMNMDGKDNYDDTNALFVHVMAVLNDSGTPSFYEAKVDAVAVRDAVLSEVGMANRMHANDPADEISIAAITTNADGSISFSPHDGHQLQVFSVAKMPLAGQTFNLKDIIHDYQGLETDSVTFGEGDYSYHFAYSETSDLHLGTIGTLNFADLCNASSTACVQADTGMFGNNTFAEFTADINIQASVLDTWYWAEGGLKFYVKEQTATALTLATCKYDPALIPTGSIPSTTDCIANTEVVLGDVVTGQFSDGTTYFGIPSAHTDDEGRLDIEYGIFAADANGVVYRFERGVEKDDTPETGVYKPFNLSAIQKILHVMPLTNL